MRLTKNKILRPVALLRLIRSQRRRKYSFCKTFLKRMSSSGWWDSIFTPSACRPSTHCQKQVYATPAAQKTWLNYLNWANKELGDLLPRYTKCTCKLSHAYSGWCRKRKTIVEPGHTDTNIWRGRLLNIKKIILFSCYWKKKKIFIRPTQISLL